MPMWGYSGQIADQKEVDAPVEGLSQKVRLLHGFDSDTYMVCTVMKK